MTRPPAPGTFEALAWERITDQLSDRNWVTRTALVATVTDLYCRECGRRQPHRFAGSTATCTRCGTVRPVEGDLVPPTSRRGV